MSCDLRLCDPNGVTRMTKWAGSLIVFYGAAHTLGALAFEDAASHAEAWLHGELGGESLSDMSPAMSAYWLSVNSFGPPLILVGLMVLWLNRRGITPPSFIGWSMLGWFVAGEVSAGPGIDQDLIILTAAVLLLVAARRAQRDADPEARTPSQAESPAGG